MSGLSPVVVALLAAIGLVGGIGITAVGPGGVLPTIGLFALTPLAPATVAGTAIVTHIATGAAGTAAYTRSGQLRHRQTRRTAALLAGAAVVGTPLGVVVNTNISKHVFGIVLGGFAAAVALLVWYRDRHYTGVLVAHPRPVIVAALGLGVSLASGIVGIGGPMLTVPLLVALRVAVLEALAAAQAQSIIIASIGTLGYALHGSIDWSLVPVIGVPELAGVLLGWKIAQSLPSRTLKGALVATLLALAPYLALHS